MEELLVVIADDPKELKKRELLDKCFDLFLFKGLKKQALMSFFSGSFIINFENNISFQKHFGVFRLENTH